MDITQAQEYVEAHRLEGVKCPCCGQYVRLYRHRLNSQMAKALVQMYYLDQAGEEYIHVLQELKPSNRMYSLMRFWGLIEPAGNCDNSKKSSGYWKITQAGKDFVCGGEVPRYVYLYDNQKYGESEEMTTIRQAFGKRFDYQELMQWRESIHPK